jgi:hypothetical protein
MHEDSIKTTIINFENIPKLITKEDPIHIHKILGVYTLWHMIYRYYNLFTYRDMFFDTNKDILLITLQGMLSISSLFFHIPVVRNRISPMINPQIRTQSIIFSLRSLFACFSFHILQHKYAMITNFVICFLTMFSADLSDKYYTNNMKLIRDMPFDKETSDDTKKYIRLFHSTIQLSATLALCTNISSAYITLVVIQLAPFFGTLVRKNIINANTWHFIYAIILKVSSYLVITFTPGLLIIYTLMFKFVQTLRFGYSINKYICWSIIFSLYYTIIYKTNIIPYINYYIYMLPFNQYYILWIATYNFVYDVLLTYKHLYNTK